MFIYKMKLHDINEYFGSKRLTYALWLRVCITSCVSLRRIIEPIARIVYTQFLCCLSSLLLFLLVECLFRTCYLCRCHFSIFLCSLLIAFFSSFAGRIRCLYFRHTDHWITQRIRKNKRIVKATEEKNSITIFVNNLIERQANHHFLLNIATKRMNRTMRRTRKITTMCRQTTMTTTTTLNGRIMSICDRLCARARSRCVYGINAKRNNEMPQNGTNKRQWICESNNSKTSTDSRKQCERESTQFDLDIY